MPEILLIDDEVEIRATLSAALNRRGFKVQTVINLKQAAEKDLTRFDLILLDLFLPDGSGVDFLEKITSLENHPAVVMISGHAGIETAVKSIQLGASDFLEKPLSLDRVLITIENVLASTNLRKENQDLSERLYGRMIGRSTAIKNLKSEIEQTAPRSQRFLILGANGTGKELAARMIHDRSTFKTGRFVPVNCAALPKDLVESELFGHVKGSFTGAVSDKSGRFAEADRGTIFLDEIGDMSPDTQAKLLRVIESGELRPVGSESIINIDLNIIAATNREISKMVTGGSFRQDLYYRLNVVTLTLPPLRDRRGDVPILLKYFLEQFAEKSGRRPIKLSDDALKYLSDYGYPGNVRELKNIAERISIYVDKSEADLADVKPLIAVSHESDITLLRDAVDGFEANYIKQAIISCDGNMSEAARLLGLERSHLYKKIKKLEP